MRQHVINADGRVGGPILRAQSFELEVAVPEESGAFSAEPPVGLMRSVFHKARMTQQKIKSCGSMLAASRTEAAIVRARPEDRRALRALSPVRLILVVLCARVSHNIVQL